MEQDSKNISVIIRETDGIREIAVTGKLVYQTVIEAKRALASLKDDEKGYILDLSAVSQIDSTGFGLIINIAKRLKPDSGMSIVVKDEYIRDLFRITKIDRLFPLANNIQEARDVLKKNDFKQEYTVKEY